MTFPLPDELSFEQGAAVLVNYQTAVFALSVRAGFRSGESLFTLGASGGVGTAAIQVAKGLGARRAIGLVSTADKVTPAREAGADEVFLVEPSVSRTRTHQGDIYVEVIGVTSSGTAGATTGQVVRRDVPYLIE